MILRYVIPITAALLWGGMPVTASATVEWEVLRETKIDGSPVDMVLSPDGARSFVLMEGGEVHVYGRDGKREEVIALDFSADRIAISAKGDRLYLSSSKEKVLRVVGLEFVQSINTDGSPFKGPAEAPVTLAVFSDFQ